MLESHARANPTSLNGGTMNKYTIFYGNSGPKTLEEIWKPRKGKDKDSQMGVPRQRSTVLGQYGTQLEVHSMEI